MDRNRMKDASRLMRGQRLGPTVITVALFTLLTTLLGVLLTGVLRLAPPADDRLAQDSDLGPEEPRESERPGESSLASEGRPGTSPEVSSVAEMAVPKDYLALRSPVEFAGVISSERLHRAASFAGNQHSFAIWTQPVEDRGTAQVSYMLEGQFTKLRGIAGISDPVSLPSSVPATASPSGMFRIYGDGNLLWESKTLAGFGSAQGFDVDVSGIEMIALVAESDANSAESSFAWGDVELLAADTSP